jgi:hypothetical protein
MIFNVFWFKLVPAKRIHKTDQIWNR